jgi:hypothetical protein
MSTGWVPKSERIIPLSQRSGGPPAADASVAVMGVAVAVTVAAVVDPFSSSGEDMIRYVTKDWVKKRE